MGISADIEELKKLVREKGMDPEEFFPSCRGCGYCCWEATCSLGVQLHGSQHPCPSLLWNGKRYVCELAAEFKDHLHIGCGCPSTLNDWRKDVKKRF